MSLEQQPLNLNVYHPYQDRPDLEIAVDVSGMKIWATRRQIADLLNLDVSTVGKHITRFKSERGVDAESSCANFAIVAADGKTRDVEHYDMTIVAYVGFRAHHSEEVRQFQDWAGRQLNKVVIEKQKIAKPFETTKRYKELRASGLTHEQAMDRRDVDSIGVEAHKRAVKEWYERSGDIAALTNHATRLVTGKSATALKRELNIKVSPRAYISSLERGALAVIEDFGALLHRRRDSHGTDELARDLSDASQVIDHDKLNAMLSDTPILPPPPKQLPPRLIDAA